MKFFVPAAEDEKEASSVYDAIVKFAKETTGWEIGPERIFAIDYVHNGKRYYAEVGKVEQCTGDLVLAILKSNAYLVCTVNRGGLRGLPILVGHEEVRSVKYFE